MPYAVVVRNRSDALVGVAPFYMSSLRFLRLFGYRTLRFVGDTASGAEYPDWIVDPSAEEEVCRLIAETLAKNTDRWDVLWLPRLASWTGGKRRVVDALTAADLRVHTRSIDFCAFDLPDSLEEFEQRFSSKRRWSMRRNLRRIKSMKGIEFVRCDDKKELPAFISALFDLHQRRWRAIGRDGVFVRRPRLAKQFYEEFAIKAFENGWLEIHGVRKDGTWKAVQYGYLWNGVYQVLQEGFDPDFEDGTGNALRHHMIGYLIENGAVEYDFLGGWTEHKRRWGGVRRKGLDVFVGSKGLKSSILFSREIWPSGRFIELS